MRLQCALEGRLLVSSAASCQPDFRAPVPVCSLEESRRLHSVPGASSESPSSRTSVDLGVFLARSQLTQDSSLLWTPVGQLSTLNPAELAWGFTLLSELTLLSVPTQKLDRDGIEYLPLLL